MKKGGRELGSAQPWCPRNKAQLVREQLTSFRFVFGRGFRILHEYTSSYVGRQQKRTGIESEAIKISWKLECP